MNGFLYIDKKENCTSRDVVNQICKIYGIRKVGHTGTLDPMATGVLVVALGDATKLIEEVTSLEKEYLATVKVGILTDTLDITGEVLKEEKDISFTKEDVERALSFFHGEIIQEVPYYSAVRVNGRRLYDYARNKEEVVLPKRKCEIKEISLIEVGEDSFTFLVKVSKGTYIRSLIRDIGEKLGIPCTMSSLRRTKQGSVRVEECISLDNINKDTSLITISEVLKNYPSYVIPDDLVTSVKNGAIIPNIEYNDKVRIYDRDGHLLALYQVNYNDPKQLKAYKMFHEGCL